MKSTHSKRLLIRSMKDRLRVQTRSVKNEQDIDSMSQFLDSVKWDSNGLAVAIAQHIDTGEVLMQAFADRAAVNETLQTGCASCVGCGSTK